MWMLNFSHPLTPEHLRRIEELTGESITEVWEYMPHFDHQRPFAEQIVTLVDEAGFDGEDWQTRPILVNPPGYAPAAVVLLAELHGRMGHFPAVIRICPVEGAVQRFEVAEVINLQAVRDAARQRRMKGVEGAET